MTFLLDNLSLRHTVGCLDRWVKDPDMIPQSLILGTSFQAHWWFHWPEHPDTEREELCQGSRCHCMVWWQDNTHCHSSTHLQHPSDTSHHRECSLEHRSLDRGAWYPVIISGQRLGHQRLPDTCLHRWPQYHWSAGHILLRTARCSLDTDHCTGVRYEHRLQHRCSSSHPQESHTPCHHHTDCFQQNKFHCRELTSPDMCLQIFNVPKMCTIDYFLWNTKLDLFFTIAFQECVDHLTRQTNVSTGNRVDWTSSIARNINRLTLTIALQEQVHLKLFQTPGATLDTITVIGEVHSLNNNFLWLSWQSLTLNDCNQ